MSFNISDRAALLSGLRGGGGGGQPTSRSSSPVPGYHNNNNNMTQQSLDDLQQMMLHQQLQFQQQPFPFMAQSHQSQAQAQTAAHQAQLFALQQSQIELQLQQIKMANLALQEQILLQHQQRSASPPYTNHHQQQRSISASFAGNTSHNLATNFAGRQAASAGGNGAMDSSYVPQTAAIVGDSTQWANYQQQQQQQYPHTAHSFSNPYTNTNSDEGQTGPELSANARYEARKGALQNLQQARQQRVHSPSPSISSTTFSPPSSVNTPLPANLDWQSQRMQYKSGFNASEGTIVSTPESVVTPPAQIDSHKRLALVMNDKVMTSTVQQQQQHHHRRNNISDASSASIQSLSISEAGSQFSPNRGPALILSKPGDEFPEEDDEDNDNRREADESAATDDSGPVSPSLTASMRAAGIHSVLSVNPNEMSQRPERRRSSSSGRHTVILSSTISDPLAGHILRQQIASSGDLDNGAAVADDERDAPSSSSSSSAASSPTSDKSEVASFESSQSTVGTSVINTSPTSSTFDKDVAEVAIDIPATRPPSSNAVHRRVVSAAVASSSSGSGSGSNSSGATTAVLNPGATVFAPGHKKNYPSSLSVSSTGGTNTPLRMFSAPARTGTPNNATIVIRQPKGPADEKDLPSKNFAGMIRRKAVGALRLAATNGARASPVSSPILPGFSGGSSGIGFATSINGYEPASGSGFSRLSSPPNGLSGPLVSQTAFNMSDLANRAMRRRSQQGGYAQLSGDFGLGVTQ